MDCVLAKATVFLICFSWNRHSHARSQQKRGTVRRSCEDSFEVIGRRGDIPGSNAEGISSFFRCTKVRTVSPRTKPTFTIWRAQTWSGDVVYYRSAWYTVRRSLTRVAGKSCYFSVSSYRFRWATCGNASLERPGLIWMHSDGKKSSRERSGRDV